MTAGVGIGNTEWNVSDDFVRDCYWIVGDFRSRNDARLWRFMDPVSREFVEDLPAWTGGGGSWLLLGAWHEFKRQLARRHQDPFMFWRHGPIEGVNRWLPARPLPR